LELQTLHIVILIVTGLLVGFSKTGVPTVGILSVTLMASVFPAKYSVGILLPMLIIADIVAVSYYRRQVVWKHLISLIPWVLIGILSGFVTLLYIGDTELKWMIGIIVLLLVAVHIIRSRSIQQASALPAWLGISLGILAGYTTMVGNAAGGVMAIYLLSRNLPKEQFIGTGAWFFLAVNVIKVPFGIGLGIITLESFIVNLYILPVILLGTWIGIKILPKLSQKQFTVIILALSVIGALQLIISA
jgi:uncharacterized membrane protein YfcA